MADYYATFNFQEMFIYFIIYAFGGWFCEVVYTYTSHKKIINRGFLYGPICPIYGISLLTLISILNNLKTNIFMEFVVATISISIIEYSVGFTLEKIFKRKYWDYTDDPFNLHGRICLHFSLLWGIASLGVTRLIHPILETAIKHSLSTTLLILFLTLFILFILDGVLTLIRLIDKTKLINIIKFQNFYDIKEFEFKNIFSPKKH